MKKLLAPSILSADFSNLQQSVRAIELAGCEWLHCDVMDGHFVPNITFGPLVVAALKRITSLHLDVHLMISEPDKYIRAFADAGSDTITVHQETVNHLHRTITSIKETGRQAGVSINPSTPVSTLENILEYVDLVLVMSVNPGFGGQKFINTSLRKIAQLAEVRNRDGLNFQIEVDGGIDRDTIRQCSDAGCDVFVAGNAVFKADNITASAIELMNIINQN
ncbi:MAG: ribulose-phosphate 3-epimerase [Ignavibacteriaceae bacterium]|nr:ribulose-phosphate 3-epimerase [Ignavibacteriaceae bacterium]